MAPKRRYISAVQLRIAAVFICVTIFLVGLFIALDYRNFRKDIGLLRSDYETNQRKLIVNEVNRAIDYVTFLRNLEENRLREDLRSKILEIFNVLEIVNSQSQASGKSPAQQREEARRILLGVRWKTNTKYYFALDCEGKVQAHPDYPVGTDVSKTSFFLNARPLLSAHGEGFVSYQWEKQPGNKQLVPKLSYVKYFPPLDWMVGTGAYLNDERQESEKLAKDYFSALRFDEGRGYIVVLSMKDGRVVANGGIPSSVGTIAWDWKDKKNHYFVRDLITAAKNPSGGFVDYLFSKPGTSVIAQKISFAKSIPDWEWCVLAGVFVDDIEKTIAQRRENLIAGYIKKGVLTIGSVLFFLGIMYSFSRQITSRAQRELQVLRDSLSALAGSAEDTGINTGKLEFEEFHDLAQQANRIAADRRQAERKTRISETRFSKIFALVPEMLVISSLEDGTFYDVNEATAQALGYTREELIGHSSFELSIWPIPEERELIARKLSAGEKVHCLEAHLRRKDGEIRVGSVSAELVTFEEKGFLILSVRDITDQRQAEENLKASETRYRSLFDGSRDALMTLAPPSWKFTSANPAALAMFGARDLEQFTTLDLSEVLPTRQPDGALSADRVRAMIEKAMKEGSSFSEFTHRRINGPTFPATVLLARIEMGGHVFLQATVRDITHEKISADALRQSEEKFRGIFDQTYQFMGLMTLEGILIDANQTALNFAGIQFSDAVGKYFWDTPWWTHSPELQEWLKKAVKKCATGVTVREEVTHTDPAGVLHYVDFSLKTIRDKTGAIAYLVCEGRDITELKNLEKELLLAQKLQSIGTLAAGIAHEINTPIQFIGDNVRFLGENLQKIMNLLEDFRTAPLTGEVDAPVDALLQRAHDEAQDIDIDFLKSEMPEACNQILEGVARVSKIVTAMKDFAHVGGDEMSPADLNRAIESTVTISRNEWKYSADLKTDFDPALPLVLCSVNDINQVVMNLIINATHAIQSTLSPGGKPRGLITVATRKKDDETVVISVKDDGTGIPPEIHGKIFDPFFTTKEVGKGTGQGLAIAHKTIVQKHKGKIWFDTKEGQGTTFFIELPVHGAALQTGPVTGQEALIR